MNILPKFHPTHQNSCENNIYMIITQNTIEICMQNIKWLVLLKLFDGNYVQMVPLIITASSHNIIE